MNSYNAIGYFTSQQPEHRYFESGSHVASFTIRVYAGKDKQGKHQSYFFDCKTWGKSAEILNDRWISKQPIGISGELSQETWQTQQGANRSRVVINVQRIDYLYQTAQRAVPAPAAQPTVHPVATPATTPAAVAPPIVPQTAPVTAQPVTPHPSTPVAVPQAVPVAPASQTVAPATAPPPQPVTATTAPQPVAVSAGEPVEEALPF